MQANFFGQVVDNHTAFIRIRTNHTDFAQYLILAMEVEVTTSKCIFGYLLCQKFDLKSRQVPYFRNLMVKPRVSNRSFIMGSILGRNRSHLTFILSCR